MLKRISIAQERALKERLRCEAMETWPDFSEPLHNRIVSTVQRRHAKEAAAVSRASSDALRRPSRLWAAFAAACLLVAVVLGWRLSLRQNADGTEDGLANAGLQRADAPANWTSVPVASPFASWSIEPTIAGLSPMDVLADRNADELDGAIASTVVAAQAADLEHDIRLAAATLLERLPVNVELVAGP